MKVLLVVTHPRENSLTYAVMNRFVEGLKQSNQEVDILDLDRDGFNPVYTAEDERDWLNPNKQYSPETRREMDRIVAADTLVFVFPLWWYSVPSMLKGYLDKVWNIGLLKEFASKKVLWICLAGGDKQHLIKYGYHDMITHYLNKAIAGYARVEESKVEFLYDTLSESRVYIEGLLDHAYHLGRDFE
ncbi:NAD(P)H oxidoreductase [Paenibacillus sp. SYP-B3998]|uniref:NAD(P)H oxidoreductase n=1 Tax=Paenibacillus sp. SYP-B3998 TaxID=2678564 RepID=A0A6G3ZTZ8_9BACL|nr:NAD(P)H oxidoreductase [Paenibacillus sp. SYP-B3998]NEW05683.1 NAD(P)H oxidoreductase [Paenibacillus sp. SYP-B3998]